MKIDDLKNWLTKHEDAIHTFMDYELSFNSEERLASTLGSWFGTEAKTEIPFSHLGIDGRGSQFAAWKRDDGSTPIVYFGSEGGAGVVANSPTDWALAIALGLDIEEYPNFETDAPSCLINEPAWKISDYDDEFDDPDYNPNLMLEAYKTACIEKFGALKTYDEIVLNLGDINDAFTVWRAEQTSQ